MILHSNTKKKRSYSTETVYFKNSHEQKLCGVISNHDAKTIILLCHGLGSNKDTNPYMHLQEKINEHGIATFRFDFLGHGESDGKPDDLTLTEAIDDILCAKHELEKMGYEKIGFIGSSFGGVGGIMAASIEQFKFLVFISPPTYYNTSDMFKSGIFLLKELMHFNKHTQKKKAHIHLKFFKDYGSHDSYRAAEKINAPVLIIQGDKDRIVPPKKTRELKNRIKNSKLKIMLNSDHHYTKTQYKLIKTIMTFIKKQTKDS